MLGTRRRQEEESKRYRSWRNPYETHCAQETLKQCGCLTLTWSMPGDKARIRETGKPMWTWGAGWRLLAGKTGLGPSTWVRCGKCVDICVEIYSILGGVCVGETSGRGLGPGVEGLETRLEKVAEQGSDFMKVANGIFCSCTEFSSISCYLRCWAGGSALSLCWRCKSKLREVIVSLGWALMYSTPNITAPLVAQSQNRIEQPPVGLSVEHHFYWLFWLLWNCT